MTNFKEKGASEEKRWNIVREQDAILMIQEVGGERSVLYYVVLKQTSSCAQEPSGAGSGRKTFIGRRRTKTWERKPISPPKVNRRNERNLIKQKKMKERKENKATIKVSVSSLRNCASGRRSTRQSIYELKCEEVPWKTSFRCVKVRRNLHLTFFIPQPPRCCLIWLCVSLYRIFERR